MGHLPTPDSTTSFLESRGCVPSVSATSPSVLFRHKRNALRPLFGADATGSAAETLQRFLFHEETVVDQQTKRNKRNQYGFV